MNTTSNTKIDPERKYVIASNKHSGNWAGCMLFWGQLTGDGEKRSFGGYTQGLDRCERYTMDEILGFSTAFARYQPGMSWTAFRSKEDVIVTEDELEALGLKTVQVCYRP